MLGAMRTELAGSLTLMLTSLTCSQVRTDREAHQPQPYREAFRPQFHFTPAINWTNDPNGLVYHEGEWRISYQYNPFGDLWGHMGWGHAVSKDLLHWRHLPVALPEENETMVYSGSAVVDHRNTSGFGKADQPPLIAIYTSRTETDQTQSIAHSNDPGRSWTRYMENPVLDVEDLAFRDPKVFWREGAKRWIMAVVLADQRKGSSYGSPDLKAWAI